MSLALLAPLLVLAAAEPSATAGPHVTASLAAERAWIQPGKAFSVGLRLQMDPEWHTYWKNPGDSGLPTRIRWTLPAGFEAGPIAWPSPERFATGPLASYGYDGEAKTTPHMFVIDRAGKLIYAGGIDDKPSTELADVAGAKNYVEAALDEALAGKPVSTPTSTPYGCAVKY